MEKNLKNKYVRKLWNANSAIEIAGILTELEYEIIQSLPKGEIAISSASITNPNWKEPIEFKDPDESK